MVKVIKQEIFQPLDWKTELITYKEKLREDVDDEDKIFDVKTVMRMVNIAPVKFCQTTPKDEYEMLENK
jgi:hypothetical protein